MSMMKKKHCNPIVINPDFHFDKRGFFRELYNKSEYKNLGITCEFVQDNHSLSSEIGTLRGMHFQRPPFAQSKLVSCLKGAIFDVALDLRVGSPTYGKWEGFNLTEANGRQLYIPEGYAHGFVTLKPNTEVLYKCSSSYAPESEDSVRWDSCEIEWPLKMSPILNEKDAVARSLAELDSPFVFGEDS